MCRAVPRRPVRGVSVRSSRWGELSVGVTKQIVSHLWLRHRARPWQGLSSGEALSSSSSARARGAVSTLRPFANTHTLSAATVLRIGREGRRFWEIYTNRMQNYVRDCCDLLAFVYRWCWISEKGRDGEGFSSAVALPNTVLNGVARKRRPMRDRYAHTVNVSGCAVQTRSRSL